MLENIASRFQTVVLVGLVVLLSSVFILQFGGPQAQGCTAGGTAWAAKVDGETVTGGEVGAIYRAVRFDQASPDEQLRRQLRRLVLDGLIERTLLANEARRLGFDLDNDEVSTEFSTKRLLYITLGRDGRSGGALVQDVSTGVEDPETGLFDAERAERFIRNALQRTETDFLRWQSEEMLADRMRQTAMAAVTVSPTEIRDAYVQEKERATVAYARFSPAYYRDRLEPSATDLDGWIEANDEAVQEEYQRQRHRYTDLEPQVRARHVLLKVDADADEATKEAVRLRAEALRARALAGEDFAALARDNSEDTGSAPRGGDLGYNPRGRMVGPFDAAQFAMEVGDISELVETRFGFHVIQVVGKREGDVPEDEAKRELAEGLYKEARAGELAREAATEALARLRAGASPEALDAYLLRQDRGEPEPAPDEGEEAEGDAEAAESADAEDDGPERSALAPQIRTPPPFGRTDNPVRGAFDSGPLVRAVFAVAMDAPYPEEPLQLGTEYVVFKVLER
ncbi:MAG: peptidylprolyl isomerase, partial [Myxococcota bacterium]